LERKIGFIWTGIFLLAGLGAAAALAADQPKPWKAAIVSLTLFALALNMTYTFLFTYQRNLPAATGIAALLAGVIAILIVVALVRRIWLTSLCHLPHFLWVGFATYVTYRIDLLNPVTR
jgi:tryptophan-rich sensory protein